MGFAESELRGGEHTRRSKSGNVYPVRAIVGNDHIDRPTLDRAGDLLLEATPPATTTSLGFACAGPRSRRRPMPSTHVRATSSGVHAAGDKYAGARAQPGCGISWQLVELREALMVPVHPQQCEIVLRRPTRAHPGNGRWRTPASKNPKSPSWRITAAIRLTAAEIMSRAAWVLPCQSPAMMMRPAATSLSGVDVIGIFRTRGLNGGCYRARAIPALTGVGGAVWLRAAAASPRVGGVH